MRATFLVCLRCGSGRLGVVGWREEQGGLALKARLRCANCGNTTELRGVSVGRTERASPESLAEAYGDLAFPNGRNAWPIWSHVRARIIAGEDPGDSLPERLCGADWLETWRTLGRSDV